MKKDRKKLINFIGSEKKMTKEEIKQKTQTCFLLNPNILEEEKICRTGTEKIIKERVPT